ncbi:MAG: ABC transporter permease [Thaumarchaeota archaeon]|nr:ABC transporter permease [Nitrososphaerota archaeon]
MSESKSTQLTVAKKRRSASQWAVALRRLRRNKAGIVGLAIVLAYLFLAMFGGVFAAYPPGSFQPLYDLENNLPPSWKHPFGTTLGGQDVFSEALHSTRNDMYVASVATGISVLIGVSVGALAGYFGKGIDAVLLGVTQIFYVFPILVLILLFSRIFVLLVVAGFGLTMIAIILGLFGWPTIAYIVRGEVLKIREMEFITASRSLGASSRRILFRHIVPNVLPPIIVISSLLIATNILLEVAVSFLGFGDPNASTWGQLLEYGRQNIPTWWVTIFSGLMVVFIVLGFNLLGDGISDALNPRLRE